MRETKTYCDYCNKEIKEGLPKKQISLKEEYCESEHNDACKSCFDNIAEMFNYKYKSI